MHYSLSSTLSAHFRWNLSASERIEILACSTEVLASAGTIGRPFYTGQYACLPISTGRASNICEGDRFHAKVAHRLGVVNVLFRSGGMGARMPVQAN